MAAVDGGFGKEQSGVLMKAAEQMVNGRISGTSDVGHTVIYCTITTDRSRGMTYDSNCSLG